MFVHASLSAIGPVVGGPRAVVKALTDTVGRQGLIAMPGFSTDAYFPAHLDRSAMDASDIKEVEEAVLGFDQEASPTVGMGVIAETFRTWPGTRRSSHPATSICLKGNDADRYLSPHSLAWSTGSESPLGHLMHRTPMKVLLIGVAWNRCSALHTAETFAEPKRTKTRRFKSHPDGPWVETPDVADDLDRLFPAVGEAFESTGAVTNGLVGGATTRVADFAALVEFASSWIGEANAASGDTE